MSNAFLVTPWGQSIDFVKSVAKKAKESSVEKTSHMTELNKIASSYGYKNWDEVLKKSGETPSDTLTLLSHFKELGFNFPLPFRTVFRYLSTGERKGDIPSEVSEELFVTAEGKIQYAHFLAYDFISMENLGIVKALDVDVYFGNEDLSRPKKGFLGAYQKEIVKEIKKAPYVPFFILKRAFEVVSDPSWSKGVQHSPSDPRHPFSPKKVFKTKVSYQDYGYTVKEFQEFETSRGVAYSGSVYMDGSLVFKFSNAGDGGMSCVDWEEGAFNYPLVALALSVQSFEFSQYEGKGTFKLKGYDEFSEADRYYPEDALALFGSLLYDNNLISK